MMSQPDISNNRVLRFLSIEQICLMLVFTFGLGGTWYGLGNEISTNTEARKEAKREQALIKKSIALMKSDIVQIRTSQHHQEKDIGRILDILEERYTNNAKAD